MKTLHGLLVWFWGPLTANSTPPEKQRRQGKLYLHIQRYFRLLCLWLYMAEFFLVTLERKTKKI